MAAGGVPTFGSGMGSSLATDDVSASPGGASEDRLHGIADLRRHTARGMIVNSFYQVMLVGVSALRGVLVAVFLAPSDYGVWGIVGLTAWTALGLKNVFGAGERYVQQSEPDQERAFQRAFTVELIFGAVAIPVAASVILLIAGLSGHPSIIAPGLVLLLGLVPAVALQFPIVTFYRRMQYRRQRTLQAVEPIGGAIVMIAAAALGAGYWSFVLGTLIGSGAAAIVAVRACPYRLAWRYDRATLRRYVRFSAPLLISAISVLALFQVIVLAGASILGLAAVGTFTLVGNLMQFVDRADTIITETLYPAICSVSDRTRLLSEVFIKSNRLSLMWAVPFGVGMTLFASDLVHFVLGSGWDAAIPLLQIMGLVTAVDQVGYNWGAFVKCRGQTWPIAVTSAVKASVIIAAAIPLMDAFGVEGIGYAFAIGAVVALVQRSVIMVRFFEGIRLLPHLVRAFAPTAVAAGIVVGLRAAYGMEHTVVAAIVMFGLYVAATIGATISLERPLLSEAVGYFTRRRPQPA
jgi:O-antigen/teichoic acid export membrane protein